MHLVAKTDFTYAGRALKAGDGFDASQSDAFILTRVGKAEEPKREDSQSAAKAEQPVELQPARGRRGNRYRRTDMRAED